jgi:hypothetical protein
VLEQSNEKKGWLKYKQYMKLSLENISYKIEVLTLIQNTWNKRSYTLEFI